MVPTTRRPTRRAVRHPLGFLSVVLPLLLRTIGTLFLFVPHHDCRPVMSAEAFACHRQHLHHHHHHQQGRRGGWGDGVGAQGPGAVARGGGGGGGHVGVRDLFFLSAISSTTIVATVDETVVRRDSATDSSADIADTRTPRSAFGTKEYWDEMYQGRGDFPGDEYSWYCGWDDTLKNLVAPYLHKDHKLLVPGVGNDRLLLDLVRSRYRHITAQDYSSHAVDRQRELLSHYFGDEAVESAVTLVAGDVRSLPPEWTEKYDAIIEKGLLDAVYLSGDGNVELAVDELFRALRPGGIFVSVSGVVPDDLRRRLFKGVSWLRDGSHDLRAGCFIFRKPT